MRISYEEVQSSAALLYAEYLDYKDACARIEVMPASFEYWVFELIPS